MFIRNRTIKSDRVKLLANCLTLLPGGYDELYEVARAEFPEEVLPHENTFLSADPEAFGPATARRVTFTILQNLIPAYIERDRAGLESEVALEKQKAWLFGAAQGLDGLATLYRKVGNTDYDWRHFGPQRDAMEWRYASFDPGDDVPWKWYDRYREVKLPEGMANWFAADFDASGAGWRKGLAPFGSQDGKLEALYESCTMQRCGCSEVPTTLWEEEVLLLRGKFTFPKIKEGHRYRLLIGGACHIYTGNGVAIYINGKLMTEQKRGPIKFEGGLPRGVLIDSEFVEEFAKGEVTIALKSFLRLNRWSQRIGNHLSLWMEEMRLPPVPAARVQP
jgi:hypothetical protein